MKIRYVCFVILWFSFLFTGVSHAVNTEDLSIKTRLNIRQAFDHCRARNVDVSMPDIEFDVSTESCAVKEFARLNVEDHREWLENDQIELFKGCYDLFSSDDAGLQGCVDDYFQPMFQKITQPCYEVYHDFRKMSELDYCLDWTKGLIHDVSNTAMMDQASLQDKATFFAGNLFGFSPHSIFTILLTVFLIGWALSRK